MAFTAKILSLRFRHLNIVGCLLKKKVYQGGGGGGGGSGAPRGQTPPPGGGGGSRAPPAPPPPPGYAPESILQLVWRFCCETGSFRTRYTKRS